MGRQQRNNGRQEMAALKDALCAAGGILGVHTAAGIHHGRALAVQDERAAVLAASCQVHPGTLRRPPSTWHFFLHRSSRNRPCTAGCHGSRRRCARADG